MENGELKTARERQINLHSPFSILHSPPATLRWLLLLLLLILPAITPLLSHNFTAGYDNAFHLWRAVEIRALLDEGILYSRWAPHMAHGYGYPLYFFQSPLSAHIAALFNGLGFSWAIAINATYALAYILSALALWLLGRDLWGERGGLVAAVAFMYAPYHTYIAFYRASMSEMVAWIFPPLILWGMRRWQLWGQRRGLATAVLTFIILMLTHDATAYAFFPLFLGWMIALSLQSATDRGKRSAATLFPALRRGLLPLILGFGGSAFFWLPTFLERHHVQFERATGGWPFHYSYNFLPLSQMLAFSHNADPTFLNDWPPRALGGFLLLAAISGAMTLFRQKRSRFWVGLLLTLALAGYLFLTLAIAQPLWDAIAILAAFQFPWRFLAPATLCAALLAGAFVYSLTDQRVEIRDWSFNLQSPISNLLIILLIVAHYGWFYPRYAPPPSDTTLTGMIEWEKLTQTLGTTAKDELLPVWVKQMPVSDTDLPVWENRLPTAVLPPHVHIISQQNSPLAATIELDAGESFTAPFNIFYFPGWQATLDGNPVPIVPTEPHGLIALNVPAGRHTITLQFGETNRWRIADAVSLLSLLLLGVSLRKKNSPNVPRPTSTELPRWPLFMLAIGLMAFKVLAVDQALTPLRQSRLTADGELTQVDHPADLRFGDQIALLGYDEWASTLPSSDPLPLALYWRALMPLERDYRVGLTLVDADGNRWSEAGLRDSRWARTPPPTTVWPTDQYALTAHLLDALPGTPPGDYRLQLSLFDKETLTPLTITESNGRSFGPYLDLGILTLTAPDTGWQADAIPMQFRHPVSHDGVTLWGSNIDRAAAAPGDPALVTLFWSADDNQTHELTLALVAETGETAVTFPLTLPAHPDGVWRSQNPLRLPISLPDGRYTWRVVFPSGETFDWATLAITAPERIMERPFTPITLEQTFGDQIRLVGANISRQDGLLQTELIWQAQQEISASYTVFVHLIAPDGRLVAQSDAIPANWQRPTPGWLPGEYIRDRHTLTLSPDLPAGEYQLVAGLYDENGRLPTTNQDHAPITSLTLP